MTDSEIEEIPPPLQAEIKRGRKKKGKVLH